MSGLQNPVQQLTLGLSLKDEATFDNFYGENNSLIVNELKKIASSSGEKIIYLCGNSGQGRSHLLQACCHHAYQYQLTSVYLPLQQLISLSPEILSGFEHLDLVCIDDIQAIAGNKEWEEAIFHLFNRVHDGGNSLVIAGKDLPKALHLQLNDLTSRLAWGITYSLQPLLDEEKLIVLMMRAQRRGMTLNEEVAKYILTHCARHMSALFSVLDSLDKASLAAQRRLTIPFVKEVLQI